jgi:hypothetical protein
LERRAIPKQYLHGRFGQVSFHNQEVLDALQRSAPEGILLELIRERFSTSAFPTVKQILSAKKVTLANQRLFTGLIERKFAVEADVVIVVTPHDLEASLLADDENRVAYNLLKGLGNCSEYLDRLATLLYPAWFCEVRRETLRDRNGKTYGGSVRYAINLTQLLASGEEE